MNTQKASSRITFSSISQIIILLLGTAFYAIAAFSMFGLGIFSQFSPTTVASQESGVLFNVAATLIVMSFLTLPGLVLGLIHLFQKDPIKSQPTNGKSMIFPNILLVGWMAFMGIAYLITQNEQIGQWLLPILQVPAVLIPIFWLYRFSIRKQPLRHSARNWSALGLNLTLQPLIIVFLELVIMVFIFVFAVLWISQSPALVEDLTTQYEQLIATNLNPDTLNRMLEPYLNNPMVQFTIFFFIAGLVPVIEELIKPFLVWRWLKHPLTPGEGFLLGLIGGSAFTLWENFNALSSATTGSWFFVVVARYGTSIIHMSTSALFGWALMKTFADKKYWRAGLAYFIVISIHGLWNFATMLEALSTLPVNLQQFPMQLAPASPFILITLLFTGLAILIGGSLILFRKPEPSSDQPLLKDTTP